MHCLVIASEACMTFIRCFIVSFYWSTELQIMQYHDSQAEKKMIVLWCPLNKKSIKGLINKMSIVCLLVDKDSNINTNKYTTKCSF